MTDESGVTVLEAILDECEVLVLFPPVPKEEIFAQEFEEHRYVPC